MSSRYGKTADIVGFLRANGQHEAADRVARAFLEPRIETVLTVNVSDSLLLWTDHIEDVKAMVRERLRAETLNVLGHVLGTPGASLDDLAIEVCRRREGVRTGTEVLEVRVFWNAPKVDDPEYVWDAAEMPARAGLTEGRRSITRERP